MTDPALKINGRDENGFTPEMARYMRQAEALYALDEKQEAGAVSDLGTALEHLGVEEAGVLLNVSRSTVKRWKRQVGEGRYGALDVQAVRAMARRRRRCAY